MNFRLTELSVSGPSGFAETRPAFPRFRSAALAGKYATRIAHMCLEVQKAERRPIDVMGDAVKVIWIATDEEPDDRNAITPTF